MRYTMRKTAYARIHLEENLFVSSTDNKDLPVINIVLLCTTFYDLKQF